VGNGGDDDDDDDDDDDNDDNDDDDDDCNGDGRRFKKSRAPGLGRSTAAMSHLKWQV
jgi:hypothetical protein